MSNLVLIIGESGSGKSTSIRNLDPNETFIINVLNKPLPFRGALNNYKLKTKESDGNYYSTDDYYKIIKTIEAISESAPNVKNIIIDDFQYIMANEFMRRAMEKSYDKFTEIGQHAWQLLKACEQARSDLCFFVLSHSDESASGKVKCKTIGKMLDNTICIEGIFTTVLHSIVSDGKYKFLTQNNGTLMAKSPMGMFESEFIENDLNIVKQKMSEYHTGA